MGNSNCYSSNNQDPNMSGMMLDQGVAPVHQKDEQPSKYLQLQARMRSPRVSRLAVSLNESKRKLKYGGAKINEDVKASPQQNNPIKLQHEISGFQPDFNSQ